MKLIALLVAAVFLVPKLMGMDDGLYDISDSTHPKLIDDQIASVTIWSTSNDNRAYYLQVRAPSGFLPAHDKMQLMISNQTVPFNGWGQEGMEKITVLDASLTNLEIVPLIAKHFHATVLDRHHPGNEMLVQFIPAKEEFSTNEPVMVTLRITNIGKTEFMYMQGGSQRGARDNQFAFTAEYLGRKMLPDAGDPMNFGGLGFGVLLKPGQSHDLSVDLRKWFNFTSGGIYEIRGSYSMAFQDPASKDFRTIWEDYACGRFEIRMKQ